MRQLLPDPDSSTSDERREVEPGLDLLYADVAFPEPPDERPYTYLGMITSIDGAATIEGRSGGLGGEGDRAAFRRLRETCDAILVGAGTARDERYRAPRADDDVRERRRERGLEPVPTMVLITRRVDLDPMTDLFTQNEIRPIVLTTQQAEVPSGLEDVTQVVRAGGADVDLRAGLAELRRWGIGYLLCEGGPSLNRSLLAADLVDELFVTVAPKLVAGSGPGITAGDALDPPRRLELISASEHESELLLRYRVQRGK